ncbi:GOG7B protein, partial [Polypterus senegalus]
MSMLSEQASCEAGGMNVSRSSTGTKETVAADATAASLERHVSTCPKGRNELCFRAIIRRLSVYLFGTSWFEFFHPSARLGIKQIIFHNLQELRRSASLATKVFIQRDYSDGTVCQFQTKFPAELDSRIERQLFEDTVKTLNGFYAEAEKIGGQSYLEGCLACTTAYIIFLCMETRYEKMSFAHFPQIELEAEALEARAQPFESISRSSGYLTK